MTRTHVILDLRSEDESGYDDAWYEGEGQLASIVPVRAELAAGDRRLLYLAWLSCVQYEELGDEESEPPVPPGLGELSGPLRALADFLRLDGGSARGGGRGQWSAEVQAPTCGGIDPVG